MISHLSCIGYNFFRTHGRPIFAFFAFPLLISILLLISPGISIADDKSDRDNLQDLPENSSGANPDNDPDNNHCAPLSAFNKADPIKNGTDKRLADDPAIHLSADHLISNQSNLFEVDGNVSIKTNRHSIEADKAQYNRREDHLNAQGNINFRKKSLLIESDNLSLDLKNDSGRAENTRYHLLDHNANGTAGTITFQNKQTESKVKLEKSTYSTCIEKKKGDKKAWQIRAKLIELHPEKNEVIARNMRLEIVNVPIIYLPYISLPLKGRKSGFLAPRPSYSSNDGIDVAVPYYFNLKPNYDLTFTPRIIESRGAQIATEFRYLQKDSSGNVGIEVLPDDNQTQSTRTYLNLNHRSRLTSNTNYDIYYAEVTDAQYFSNLGTELNTVNKSHLSRGFSSETQGENWLLHSTIQDYQMLDNNLEPYRRVPQFDLNILHNFGPLYWRNSGQYSFFHKNNQDYIHRAIFAPRFSTPLRRRYGYITPTIGLNAAFYQRSTPEIVKQHHLNWQFNTKAGLFFERTTRNSYQTITPEIQYSYIPYVNQSHLPIIDSNTLNFDIDQLFSENRYSGNDRVGDENRLSWSLSADYTRAKQIKPLFYTQIAQALYLTDHQNQLANEKTINKNDIVSAAAIKTNLSKHVSGKAQAYHFLDEKRLNNANMSLNYKNYREQVELSYRYADQLIEQVSIVGILNISNRWRIASRWLYSLNSERTREALLGLEYNSCCWAVRLMGRQYATRSDKTDADLRSSVGLQIELKGLTKIGSSLDKQFSDEVFGNQ